MTKEDGQERLAKHTPGPWRTGDLYHTVFGPPNGNPSPEVIAELGRHNVKANARLIAAAPLMESVIEAGVEAVNAYGGGLPDGYGLPKCLSGWLDWAESTLKQAKGE